MAKLFRNWLAAMTAGLVLASTLAGVGAASGSATLTLVPNSGSYHTGDQFTLTIHENSTDQINAVEADLLYDATKLQFVSLSNAGSFDLYGPSSGGNGKVQIPVAKSGPPLSGDQIVGTVTFQVLASSGSTDITFDSTSAVIRQSDQANVWDGNPAGATVTIASTTSSGGATPTTTTTTAPKTTTKSTSTKSTSTKTASTPTAPAPAPTVAPTSPSYIVAIKVTDSTGKAIAGAKVTLDTKTESTLATGVASFAGVSAGNHTVTAENGPNRVTKTITVMATTNNLELQEFGVVVAASKQVSYLWVVVLIVALLVIGGGGLTLGQIFSHHPYTGAVRIQTNTSTPPPVTTNPTTINPPADTGIQPVTPTHPGAQLFYPTKPPAKPEDSNNKQEES